MADPIIVAPAGSSKPCLDLVEWLNAFLPELYKTDKIPHGEERIKAFVGLANEWDVFTPEEAVTFSLMK